MQVWALLQFIFALVVAIGCFAIASAELHVIERAEEQEWEDTIAAIREHKNVTI